MTNLLFSLIAIILFLFPLGQIEVLPLSVTSVRVYFHDVIIFLAVIAGFVAYWKKTSHILRLKLIFPIIAFASFGLLSLLINPLNLTEQDWLTTAAYLARYCFYAAIYPVTVLMVRDKPALAYPLLTLLFFAGVALAGLGIMQYFLYPNLRNLYYLGWDPHQYRLFSTLFDPNFTGIILVFTIFLGWSIMKVNQKLERSIAGGIILAFGALILTYSRSSYLSFVVSLPLLDRHTVRRKVLVGSGLILLISVLLLPRPFGEGVRLERVSTIVSRLESYQKGIEIIRRYPWFGVGFNAYRYGQRRLGLLPPANWREIHSGSGTDNSFIFAWATVGIGGLISFVYLWGKAFLIARDVRSQGKIFSGLVASIFAVIVHSFFVNSLFYPWVMLWLWLVLAIGEAQVQFDSQIKAHK